jgi:hypothetical protein
MPLTFDPNKEINHNQKLFKKAIFSNDYKSAEQLIQLDDVYDPAIFFYALKYCLSELQLDLFKLLLDKSDVDPSLNNNELINYANEDHYYEFAALIINYPNIDPTLHNSIAIVEAEYYGNCKIVDLLFSKDIVRNALEVDKNELYLKLKLEQVTKSF